MQVLAIGNRSRFKKEVENTRDYIILSYNNDVFIDDKGKEYTEGYIKGMDKIIELLAKYERKEIDQLVKNVSRETIIEKGELKHDV